MIFIEYKASAVSTPRVCYFVADLHESFCLFHSDQRGPTPPPVQSPVATTHSVKDETGGAVLRRGLTSPDAKSAEVTQVREGEKFVPGVSLFTSLLDDAMLFNLALLSLDHQSTSPRWLFGRQSLQSWRFRR